MNALIPSTTGLLPIELDEKLEQLTAALDQLADYHDRLSEACRALDCKSSNDRARQRAKSVLQDYRESRVRKLTMSGEIDQLDKSCLAFFPNWWGADGKVHMSAIAFQVGVLIGSFNQRVANPEVFSWQLIRRLCAWRAHPYVVEQLLRELPDEHEFLSIAKVAKAYREAAQKWDARFDARDDAEDYADELADLIAQTEREAAERAEREAKAEAERREHEERMRLEREQREAAEEIARRERRDEAQKYLDSVSDWRRYKLKAGDYQTQVDAIILAFQNAAFQGCSLRISARHHEACGLGAGRPCDCRPVVWATINHPSRYIFLADGDQLHLIENVAEAKARAIGKLK